MSEARPESRLPGLVYTFYSYKGGVGRSMALANVGVLENPGDPGQHLQMDTNSLFWSDQEEKELCRPAIEGIEVYPRMTATEGQHQLFCVLDLAVGDRNTVTDACTPEPFPFQQDLQQFLPVKTGMACFNQGGKFGKHFILYPGLQVRNNIFRSQKTDDGETSHGSGYSLLGSMRP